MPSLGMLTHVCNGVEEGEVGAPHIRIADAVEEAAHCGEHQRGSEGREQPTQPQQKERLGVCQQLGSSWREEVHLCKNIYAY